MDADSGHTRRGRDDLGGRHTDAAPPVDSSGDRYDRSHSRRDVLGAIASIATGVSVGSVEARPEGGRSSSTGDANGTDDSRSAGGRMKIGIHDGSGVDAVSRVDRIESWIGPRFGVQNLFIPFDDGGYELDELFGRVLPAIWRAGRTPMLTWELYLSSGPTPENVVERVLRGEYDAFLDEWAERMRAALRTVGPDRARSWTGEANEPAVYVRLAHEANGNWYPWAPAFGTSTPEEYRQMWRYVPARVEREVGGGLAWVWAMNGVDIGPYSMEELYPGDRVVDWLGVDNYNWARSEPWSRWQSPDELFVSPVERVRDIVGSDRPVGITEFASSSATDGGYDVERKAAWIAEAFDALHHANVDMAVWFNQDRKTDWAVFDGARGTDRVRGRAGRYEVYPAYKDGVLWHDR